MRLFIFVLSIFLKNNSQYSFFKRKLSYGRRSVRALYIDYSIFFSLLTFISLFSSFLMSKVWTCLRWLSLSVSLIFTVSWRVLRTNLLLVCRCFFRLDFWFCSLMQVLRRMRVTLLSKHCFLKWSISFLSLCSMLIRTSRRYSRY